MLDLIDAALTYLVESEQNIRDTRDEHPPHVIQSIANTSDLAPSDTSPINIGIVSA